MNDEADDDDMTRTWSAFLQERGASVEADRIEWYRGEAAAPAELRAAVTTTTVTDLSHLGLIIASGPDLGRFFQNQFTNDFARVDAGHTQLSAYCTPQGRVAALFRIYQHHGLTCLEMPRDTVATTMERLLTYRLRSRVDIEDGSDRFVRIGVSGPDARRLVTAVLGTAPGEPGSAIGARAAPAGEPGAEMGTSSGGGSAVGAGVTAIALPGPWPRLEVVAGSAEAPAIWDALAAGAMPVGAGAWDLLEIRAGLPEVRATTREAFIPQMLNLHWLDGVSFAKGCYPGQEIVARMRYLGKLKRRMYLARADAETVPAPGDPLTSTDGSAGRDVGRVVRAQRSPERLIELLAVIQTSAVGSADIFLDDGTPDDGRGSRLELLPLPYATDQDDAS